MGKTRKRKRTPTQRVHLTKRFIENLDAKETRYTIYDDECRDLGLRIDPNYRKSFFWFRHVRGTPTFRALGTFPATTVEAARGAAVQLSGKLDALKRSNYAPQVEDPFTSKRGELTLGAALEDYIKVQLAHAKNPARAEANARSFFKHLQDWEDRKLSQITRREIVERHREIGETAGQTTANRVVQLARTLFNFTTDQELFLGANPARKIRMFREHSRSRVLTRDELPRFFAALKKAPKDTQDAIKLLCWTAARRGDVLSMKWEDISLRDNAWRVPTPKAGKPYLVPLTEEAKDVLRGRKRQKDSRYVFPSFGESGHLINLNKRWKELKTKAGLTDLHLHDLRKVLASVMADKGVSMQVIGRALGHADSHAATEVYAQLDTAPVAKAMKEATYAVVRASRRS